MVRVPLFARPLGSIAYGYRLMPAICYSWQYVQCSYHDQSSVKVILIEALFPQPVLYLEKRVAELGSKSIGVPLFCTTKSRDARYANDRIAYKASIAWALGSHSQRESIIRRMFDAADLCGSESIKQVNASRPAMCPATMIRIKSTSKILASLRLHGLLKALRAAAQTACLTGYKH